MSIRAQNSGLCKKYVKISFSGEEEKYLGMYMAMSTTM